MVLNIFYSLLPVVFLINFFYTEHRFHKKNIQLSGSSPINYILFFSTKYLLALLWIAMALDIWDIKAPGTLLNVEILHIVGTGLWCLGFLLLYIGWFSLGKNIRMGVAKEKTEFISRGVYKISRNPMYVGLYLTFIGGSLFSLNIIYILLTIHIIVVHHLITLSEEKKLIDLFGEEYQNYCKKVRRYI